LDHSSTVAADRRLTEQKNEDGYESAEESAYKNFGRAFLHLPSLSINRILQKYIRKRVENSVDAFCIRSLAELRVKGKMRRQISKPKIDSWFRVVIHVALSRDIMRGITRFRHFSVCERRDSKSILDHKLQVKLLVQFSHRIIDRTLIKIPLEF